MPTVMPILFMIIIYLLMFILFFFLLPKIVRLASVAWYQGKKIVDEGSDK